jgi:hypothetical protein
MRGTEQVRGAGSRSTLRIFFDARLDNLVSSVHRSSSVDISEVLTDWITLGRT